MFKRRIVYTALTGENMDLKIFLITGRMDYCHNGILGNEYCTENRLPWKHV